jgi:hypothetical protein
MNDAFTHTYTQYRLHAHLDILEKQFSRPTATGGRGSAALTSDGYSDFFAFSTGRRGVASLHTVFTLRPRHDFFQYAAQVLWGLVDLLYAPTDEVTLDFELHATGTSVPDFVWGLVAKGEANSIRKERWDLVSRRSLFFFLYRRRWRWGFSKAHMNQTFTKTTENPQLPHNVVIMSGKSLVVTIKVLVPS